VSSLRLDIRGVGDSGGPDGTSKFVERFYSPESIDDVALGIEYLRDHFGARRVAVVGLCSGAFAAFHLAAAREDLEAAVLVNPQLLFWDTDERALTQWTHITKRSQLRRLVTGQVTSGGVLNAPRRAWRALVATRRRGKGEISHGEAVVNTLGRIRQNGTALTFVYSLRDLGLTYLERQLGDVSQSVISELGGTLDVVEGADHTFRPLWTQDRLREIVEGALEGAGVLPSDPGSSGWRSDEVAADGKLVP
jgi:pimeloyl-ACP methyl ester carboxylesterase